MVRLGCNRAFERVYNFFILVTFSCYACKHHIRNLEMTIPVLSSIFTMAVLIAKASLGWHCGKSNGGARITEHRG